jgi:peptidoglycan/xylan/chitin deacetylase (PgdA/CDA1 family)
MLHRWNGIVRHLLGYVVDCRRRKLDFTIGDELKRRFTLLRRTNTHQQIFGSRIRYLLEALKAPYRGWSTIFRVKPQVKYWTKRAIAAALFYSGVFYIWQRIVLRRRAVVLMYHRVLTKQERAQSWSHPAVVIDCDTFDKQMEFLKRWFVVLALRDFAERFERNQPFPTGSILITFDDGWEDNFTNALPILRRHNLPALIFLPENYIGAKRAFWQESLARLLALAAARVRREPSERSRFAATLSDADLAHVLDIAEGDRAAILAAVASQKRHSREATWRLIGALTTALGPECESLSASDGFIDWSQVAEMAEHEIAFGGHGVEHLLLTQVSDAEAHAEISGSKAMIDRRLNGTTPTFSFPNGYWTEALRDQVKAAGFRLAFITKRGFVRSDDDPFTIRRLNIHQDETATLPMFLARLVGLW